MTAPSIAPVPRDGAGQRGLSDVRTTASTPGELRVARIGGVGRVSKPWHPLLRPHLRGCSGYWDTAASAYRVRMPPHDRVVMVVGLGRPFRQVRHCPAMTCYDVPMQAPPGRRSSVRSVKRLRPTRER